MTCEKPQLTQQTVRALIKQITGQANTLTIPRIFISLTGDHIAALLLSQIVYWGERASTARRGWFYKSHEDWERELGLSPFQVRRAMGILEKFGVSTQLRRVQGAPTLHYSIDKDVFEDALISHLENRDVAGGRNPKVKKLNNRETPQSESEETPQSSLSEITSETTAKTTRSARARGSGSRFDLPTRRRYAASRPDIKNPEGFARTLSSGAYDSEIATWLASEERRAQACERRRREMPGTANPELLAKVHEGLRVKVNLKRYAACLALIELMTVEEDLLRFAVPDEATAQEIAAYYREELQEAIDAASADVGYRFEFYVMDEGVDTKSAVNSQAASRGAA